LVSGASQPRGSWYSSCPIQISASFPCRAVCQGNYCIYEIITVTSPMFGPPHHPSSARRMSSFRNSGDAFGLPANTNKYIYAHHPYSVISMRASSSTRHRHRSSLLSRLLTRNEVVALQGVLISNVTTLSCLEHIAHLSRRCLPTNTTTNVLP
jgi:hypothetical protein